MLISPSPFCTKSLSFFFPYKCYFTLSILDCFHLCVVRGGRNSRHNARPLFSLFQKNCETATQSLKSVLFYKQHRNLTIIGLLKKLEIIKFCHAQFLFQISTQSPILLCFFLQLTWPPFGCLTDIQVSTHPLY